MAVNQALSQDPKWSNAATLIERVGSFTDTESRSRNTVADVEKVERLMKRWRSQRLFATDSYFAQRLATDGVTEDDLFVCLSEPVEALHARLVETQTWLEQLFQAFSRPPAVAPLPLPETLLDHDTVGFLNIIEPLLHDAIARVEAGAAELALASHQHAFDPSTVVELLFARLPQRLLAMLGRTLVLELHVARLQGELSGDTPHERFCNFVEVLRSTEVAIRLLQEYPVLARQLVIHIDHWVDFSLEFLRHLKTDWDQIRTIFAREGDPGLLVEIGGDMGDSHRRGRSVLIAKFASGLQVVYKPRSLAVDAHFQELLVWLNEKNGDHCTFRTLKVLPCGDHGWVEFIAAHSCRSPQELCRFYERQGAYLALLYALEATDLHFENLTAAGEHPVPLDLETLFHPRIGELDLRQSDQLVGTAINDSVLRVGLLPQRFLQDEESAGVDLSGLGTLRGQLSPRPIPQWQDPGTDQMQLTRKRVAIPTGQNRPTLNDVEVNPLDHVEAIVTGFTRLYRTLLQHRKELMSDQGPLASFLNDRVRVVIRSTGTYCALLRESFHPDVLRNALDRDRLFDQLWTSVEQCPDLARVISDERQDLQHGDVPLFTTSPSSRDLCNSSQERIPDFFDEPGIVPVHRRIQALSDHDCERQVWFIRASLATLSSFREGTRRLIRRRIDAAAPADSERLLLAACSVGDRLEALALQGEQDASWIGLILANQRDWTLLPLWCDLYDGLPGVALFLAYLGDVTQSRRYTDLAKRSLATMRRLIERGPSPEVPMGAFTGWGGIIYVLTHLSQLWNQSDQLIEARAMIGSIERLIEQDSHFDIIGGAAGTIGSLLGLYQVDKDSQALAAAICCGNHLLSHAQPMQRGVGWSPGKDETPLTGFSHGAAGIGWALLRLAAVTGDERFYSGGWRAFEYERSLYSSVERNWPDLREPDPADEKYASRFAMAWCHGAPGIGLSRLLSLPHLNDQEVQSEIQVALHTTLSRGFGNSHSLCHGDLGNLELLLEASLALGEPRWRAEVSRIAGILLESISQNGPVCGNPIGVESPGLMTGLAGIGYELLRLAEPKRVPSVLALAPPIIASEKSTRSVLAAAATR
jgi:type 2 lantibiotic biosynthesis protein LanM